MVFRFGRLVRRTTPAHLRPAAAQLRRFGPPTRPPGEPARTRVEGPVPRPIRLVRLPPAPAPNGRVWRWYPPTRPAGEPVRTRLAGPVPRPIRVVRVPPAAPPNGHVWRWGPPRISTIAVTGEAIGLYRVSSSLLARYELYRGVDGAAIDFDTPYQTSSLLPFSTAAQTPGHTYAYVVRRRNRYDLVSQNIAEWVVDVDGGGAVVPTPPSAPEFAVAAAAAGTVLVTAEYAYDVDGAAAGDTWLVYLRSDGTDPDPDIDTPATSAMRLADGVAKLSYTSAAFAEGATVKVLVRVRRSGTPDVDSTNADILTAIATLLGPAAVSPASAFLGRSAEQTQ